MSKDELVSAYLQGRVSRRMFVRGLIAAGVSVTAAVTYSQVLSANVTSPARRLGAQQYGGQYGGQYGDQYSHYGGPAVAPSAVLPAARFTG